MTTDMDALRVDLGERSYDILVGEQLLATAGQYIPAAAGEGACWIVTECVYSVFVAR